MNNTDGRRSMFHLKKLLGSPDVSDASAIGLAVRHIERLTSKNADLVERAQNAQRNARAIEAVASGLEADTDSPLLFTLRAVSVFWPNRFKLNIASRHIRSLAASIYDGFLP